MSEPLEPDQPQAEPQPGETEPATPDVPASPDHGDEEEAGAEESEPAEPETPDGEPPPQPPQPAGMSQQDIEKNLEKLKNEAVRHKNRVEEIMDEAVADLVPCELCLPHIPGFHYPAEWDMDIPPLQQRLMAVLRTPNEPDFQVDPELPACDLCNGEGKVLTGSKVPGHDLVTCRKCNGSGIEPTTAVTSNGELEPAPALAVVAAGGDDVPLENQDGFGTPRYLSDGRENPNWMRNPQAWNRDYPVAGNAGERYN